MVKSLADVSGRGERLNTLRSIQYGEYEMM